MYQPGDFDIAIVGLAGKFPGAGSVDQYWRNLVEGRESIRFFTDDELDRAGVPREIYGRPGYVKAAPVIDGPGLFDARFFNYSKRDAELMDPQHRVFLQCCYHALENAGHTANGFDGRVGVYAGSAMNTYFLYANLAGQFAEDYLPTLLASDKDFLSTRVSYQLNLTGPSLTIQTACSTSLVAIHTACQSLINEECDMALAGGVAIRVPHIAGHQAEEGSVFSPDGHCRPFDARAAGTIFGSGAGVVVLKRAVDAVADGDTITAVIKGSAVNNDGNRKSGYTAPGIEMQSQAAIEAYAAAGVEPEMISYIEAHGTGTYLGDPIEIAALTSAFRTQTQQQQFCRIGSVKSNIGHLDAAAGVAGLIKTALALKNRKLPSTLHYTTPNPQIDFAASPFIVNHELTGWETDDLRYAAVNSLGIGGTNAHIVLEEGPRNEADLEAGDSQQRPQLLVLSAKTETALDATAANIVSHLTEDRTTTLADAAFTLQAGRDRMEHRRSVVVGGRDDVELLAGQPRAANRLDNPGVVFMFPGQGAQYAGMARGLYRQEPEFAQQIDAFHEQLQVENGIDLRGVLFPGEGEEDTANELLRQTHITQPALFAVEYALARLWISWGVQPAGVTGHSVGEYAAACIAGVMNPADALRLVALRGALINALPEGKMLAVGLPGEAVQQRLNSRLELAAMNSPGASVVAGVAEMVDEFEAELSGQGVPCQILRTSHAFHSGMMTPVLDDFRNAVQNVQLHRAQLPVYSTVTGATADPAAYAQPQFWVDNIRQPVRFSEAAAEMLQQPNRVLLEVGPGQTLSGFIREQPGHSQQHVVCNSLRHPREDAGDYEFLLRTLGKLWESGVTPNWQSIHGAKRQRVALPGYAFDNQEYWLAGGATAGGGVATSPALSTGLKPAEQPQIPRKPVQQWLYKSNWQPIETGRLQDSSSSKPSRENEVWLVFGEGEPSPEASSLVITVKPGDAFERVSHNEYRINIHSAEDYRKLLSSLSESDTLPSHILHTWMTGSAVDDQQELQRGLHSLAFLAAATGNVCPLHELKLYTITQNAIPAVEGEHVIPARAAALAACKLIPQEYPGVACRHIDLSNDTDVSAIPQSVMKQSVDHSENCFAYRNGQLLCESFDLAFHESAEPTQRLRDGDTYLLFGGLGGIGLTIAHEIASQARVNLVLAGRSSLPPVEEANSQQLQKHQAIATMRKMGCEVLTVAGDISQRGSLAAMLKQVAERFGAVHGVIHAAGIAGPARPMQQSTQEDIEGCMPAKLQGVAMLEELLADQPLRFIIGFSTIGATLYHHRIGELSYLSANMALDAFPFQSKAKDDNIFRQTIQWDEWRGAGMAADIASKRVNPASPLFNVEDTISPGEGASVFAAALATEEPRVIVSVHNLSRRIAGATLPDSHLETLKAQPAAPARSDTLGSLKRIWSDLLGTADIRPGDDFFDLGGSSLLAVRMNSQINAELGKKLPVGSILEVRTIERLAQLIDGGQKKSHPSLVAIQQEGARTPLFLMHAAGGNVMFYRQLASHLGPDQPVYGLQSQAILDGEATFRSIEEMARDYVAAMIATQPEGPYLVGGYCMGGTISLEVAQQLRRQGKEVAMVAMFETYNWEKSKRRNPMSGSRFWLEKVYFALRNVVAAGGGASRFVREKLGVVSARRNVWRGELQRKVQTAQATDQQMLAQLWENNDRAAMQYRPEAYAPPVTIFRPKVKHGVFRDCEFDNINVRIETLPCFPAGMMLEPFAAELAQRLTNVMQQAVSAPGHE